MSDGNFLCSIGGSLSCRKLPNRMQDVGAIVPVPTLVADADCYVLQGNEPVFVLEGFSLHDARPNCTFAILASIPVHDLHTLI